MKTIRIAAATMALAVIAQVAHAGDKQRSFIEVDSYNLGGSRSAASTSKPKEIVVVGSRLKKPMRPSASNDVTVPKPRKPLPAAQQVRAYPPAARPPTSGPGARSDNGAITATRFSLDVDSHTLQKQRRMLNGVVSRFRQ